MPTSYSPDLNCPLCPRLAQFRDKNRHLYPTFHNNPVPSFGELSADFLIVGLAPGLKGANQTGRPFTADYAGDLLYPTLLKYGFANGTYSRHSQDGLTLTRCRITNAVRCVPPENKPLPDEIKICNRFLTEEIKAMPQLSIVLSLGLVAHKATLMALGLKQSAYSFSHGATHILPNGLKLVNSYHCSRYNTQTNRLTTEMFEDVIKDIQDTLS